MAHLADVSVDDLQRALADVERAKPAQRLLAAIAYKHGVSQTELAAWHDVERRTVYGWLSRFEERPLADAARDAPRSGRPSKLDETERDRLERALENPPSEEGYDASAWTPALVQQFVADRFDVRYSTPSCRRLLSDLGP